MSTHDYVIDNQSAPAFRADLNNVLAAIASQNSSGTAPTVTFANMIWYDTTNNQIKKRNETNSDPWIVLGTIDETAGTFTPSGERALATQVQAETGTDSATLMTPLRVAQAIDAQVVFPETNSIIFIATLNTTSGASQTLTGLDLTAYKEIIIYANTVSVASTTTNPSCILSLNGFQLGDNANGRSTSLGWMNQARISLLNGFGYSFMSYGGSTSTVGMITTISTGTTSLTFSVNTSNFDAGSFSIYGVK